MTLIAGASRYMAQSTLSGKMGATFTPPNILGESGIPDLLSSGSLLRVQGGPGLSSSARYLNSQQIGSNAGTINTLFSFTGGANASIEAAQTIIAGLRSTIPVSRIVDTQVDGTAAAADPATGTNVDTTV